MITARLKGGLGNQMFQLATAYGAAKLHNNNMVIDFNISHHGGQGHPHRKYEDNLYKDIPRGNFKGEKFDVYHEPHFHYAPIPKFEGNLMIDGYFQTEKYFNHCRDDIIKLFTIPEDIKQGVKDKIHKIKTHFDREKAVCIHVRRGEYLKLPKIHPVQTKQFFLDAMDHYDKSETVFIYISDDMDWCIENLNYYKSAFCNTGYHWDVQPIATDLGELFDMHLASQCDGNVVSNSSFGWWGAWLSEHTGTIVAPKVWFGSEGPHDYHDLQTDGWVIL